MKNYLMVDIYKSAIYSPEKSIVDY